MKKLFLLLLASLFTGVQQISAQSEKDNYVTITTQSGDYDGMWSFYVAPYDVPFVPGCWIDWNNNGVKEDGEDITEDDWMNSVLHPIDSNTISIHGNITYMSFYGLTLTAVDISNTDALVDLDLSGNLLETIDLSKNTSVKTINLSENNFKTIDFVNAPQFKSSSLSYDPELTSLDISSQKALTDFVFTDNENISSFDFSKNPNLEFLYLEAIPLEKIDLSANTKLTQISIAFTSLSDITLPEAPGMKSIALHNNNLSGTIDASQYKHLEDIFFQNNNVNNLIIAKDVKELNIISCYMNDLQTASFMPVINNLYDRSLDEELYRGCIFMIDSEPLDESVVDKNSLTESAVLDAAAKAWDVIDYAGANMYPYPGIDDAVGILDVRNTTHSLTVSRIADRVVVKVPATLIGRTLTVYDMSGREVYTRRLTTSTTLTPSLDARHGTYIFTVDRQSIKAEI